MSNQTDPTRTRSAAQVLSDAAKVAARASTSKDAVVARIRARRSRLSQAAAVAEAEAALAELQRRTQAQQDVAAEASLSAVAADASPDPGIPVQARLLDPAPRRAREFPRSLTLRMALRHPALFALGAGLIWRMGPTRLLLLTRVVMPLIRK